MPRIEKKRKLDGNAPAPVATAAKSRPGKQSASALRASKHIPKSLAKPTPAPEPVDDESSDEDEEEEEEEKDNATEQAQNGATGDEVAKKTFADLGVIDSLCDACENVGYKHPTPIQEQSIPLALEGKDM